ncbi:hypothetical protein GCM10025788_25620 [Serinicoccus chungangensis]
MLSRLANNPHGHVRVCAATTRRICLTSGRTQLRMECARTPVPHENQTRASAAVRK